MQNNQKMQVLVYHKLQECKHHTCKKNVKILQKSTDFIQYPLIYAIASGNFCSFYLKQQKSFQFNLFFNILEKKTNKTYKLRKLKTLKFKINYFPAYFLKVL